MSTENPRESGPQGLEQKEWQGQRWEYLVITIYNEDIDSILGQQKILRRGGVGIVEMVDPDIKRYKEKLEELKADKNSKYNTLPEFLNYLGFEGWELVGSAPHQTPVGDSYSHPFLFMKRPARVVS